MTCPWEWSHTQFKSLGGNADSVLGKPQSGSVLQRIDATSRGCEKDMGPFWYNHSCYLSLHREWRLFIKHGCDGISMSTRHPLGPFSIKVLLSS